MTKSEERRESHKAELRKLWADVFVAYTSSSNSTSKETGLEWADMAVREYNERYNPIKHPAYPNP